jgi:D-alanyl-D-alanine dipeptidase
MKLFLIICAFLTITSACQSQDTKTASSSIEEKIQELDTMVVVEDSIAQTKKVERIDYSSFADTTMVEIIKWDTSFVLDIRYATPDNFMKEAVYPCGKCLLRKRVAEALIAANNEFKTLGYRIKIFDGYRPLSVQWILWNKTSNKNYVANPRTGSNHNRGRAVDLTLVDETGEQLDMGTKYDFFGKRANHTYTNLPKKVLENRLLLKKIMLKHGFTSIRSEWWHYNFKTRYALSDEPLPCD